MATAGARFPGASGDYIHAPDSVGLSITGDITLIACLAPDDRSPTATLTVVAKSTATGSQRSYFLLWTTGGTLELSTSALGGTTFLAGASTAAVGGTDGEPVWIAATLDVNDGGGNRVYKFYTSNDPIDTPVADVVWTQLGTTVTTAGTAAIFDSTAVTELGAFNAGTSNRFIGVYYYAEIRSGVAALDGSNHLVGGSTAGDPNILTDPASSAVTTFSDGTNTWTVAGNVDLLGLVQPTGIASAEAFGTITLLPGAVTVAPTGIASEEAFGTIVLSLGGVVVEPSGIASAEAFGTIVLVATQTIVLDGIASAEAFGTIVVAGPLILTGISSGEAFGTITLVAGGIAVVLNGIASSEAFGTLTVAPSNTIVLSGIATAEAFGTIAVWNNMIPTLLDSGLDTTDATAYVTNSFTIYPRSVIIVDVRAVELSGASHEAVVSGFGLTWTEDQDQDFATTGRLTRVVAVNDTDNRITDNLDITFAETQTSCRWGVKQYIGADLVDPIVNSGAMFFSSGTSALVDLPTFAAVVNVADGTLALGGADSIVAGSGFTTIFNTAGLFQSQYKTNDDTVDWSWSASQAGAAVASEIRRALAVTIIPTGITSSEAFGTTTVVLGSVAQTVIPTGIPSAEAFGTINLVFAQTIILTGIASAEAFGTPIISFGQLLILTGIPSAEAFGTLTVVLSLIHLLTPPLRVEWDASRTQAVYDRSNTHTQYDPSLTKVH